MIPELFIHIFLEVYQPLLIIISGAFSYSVLHDKVCKIGHSEKLTTTHILEHYLVSKLSVLAAWLVLYPLSFHLIHEISNHKYFTPITEGTEGIVLQIAIGLALLSYTLMSIHLWAEGLEKYKKRYFK